MDTIFRLRAYNRKRGNPREKLCGMAAFCEWLPELSSGCVALSSEMIVCSISHFRDIADTPVS